MSHEWAYRITPLPVVLPLLVAAILGAAGKFLNRRTRDVIALLTNGALCAICFALTAAAARQPIVYWFGAWSPDIHPGSPHHFPIGICFCVDAVGAALASLVCVLALAASFFSWEYFEEVGALFHGLMLVFVAAMCGLCLTGDLFNLFVWFELMTAAAVALCGYKSEESWPLLGALNFAVVNTVGAFLSLIGVALLYAQTGSLNMAEVGRTLAAHPPATAFLLVSFLFVIAGFLVKMALAPFQFWLADAHAVAPTPVCVLFSGVMVELGLYAIARLHWMVLAPSLHPAQEAAVSRLFLLAGALTCILGAIYCFSQRHLKRMLAFSTISHVGLMVMAFSMLDASAGGGVALYLLSHGLIKGSLFLCAGILLHRCGSVDEHDLRHGGGNLRPLGVLLTIGALALAGLPPFGTFYASVQIHHAAERLGLSSLQYLTLPVEALTAGAILRFTARVFMGWGKRREATSRGAPHIPMDMETAGAHDKTPMSMWLPAVVLLATAALLATPHQFRQAATTAIARFHDGNALTGMTLDGAAPPAEVAPPLPAVRVSVHQALSLGITILIALLALFPQWLGQRANWVISRWLVAALRPLRRLQSGNVGDYVAWFALGMSVYGGLLLFWSR